MELGALGIRVNAILPGAVQGERIERVFESRARVAGQRVVDPRDIGALAVFLASDAGKSISEQMLPIDNDMQRA